ncbi:MAG: type II toxin-antitoxin system ParD family antitoxin [Rhodanobacter sp.]
MATVPKTITVTDQHNSWMADQVDDGCFTNDSERIRERIRFEQERIAERDAVRQALIDGERSGEPQRFDFVAFIRRKRTEHGG